METSSACPSSRPLIAPSLLPHIGHYHSEAVCQDVNLSVTGNTETSRTCHRRKLEGKVAIVTGGCRGIGEAIVRQFVSHGAVVIIADVDDVSGAKLASELAPRAAYVHCDVSVESDVEKTVRLTLHLHGQLDIMVNNAGVLGSQKRKSIAELEADDLDAVLRVNVKGVAFGMKHAVRAMAPRRTGRIISVASVAGVMGGMGPHAYTASKHAIVGLIKSAACELGRLGIRVNAISPFGVATRMLIDAWCEDDASVTKDGDVAQKMEEMVEGLGNLKGVYLRADDVARAALFLASDDSAYVSGHNLVLDGGVTVANNCIGL